MLDYRQSLNFLKIEKVQTNIQKKIKEDIKKVIEHGWKMNNFYIRNQFILTLNVNNTKFSDSNITPIKKVRLINYQPRKSERIDCFLTIWRPSDEILEILSEGNRLKIYHLTASPNRYLY